MITGSGGDDHAERDRRRAAVVEAATRLAAGPPVATAKRKSR
jgi:hypothetical protein